jgi:hypothetical protein
MDRKREQQNCRRVKLPACLAIVGLGFLLGFGVWRKRAVYTYLYSAEVAGVTSNPTTRRTGFERLADLTYDNNVTFEDILNR